jgi:hypothetical protein
LTETLRIGHALEFRRFEVDPNPVKSGDGVGLSLEIHAYQAARVIELAVLVYSSLDARIAIIDFRSAGLPISLAREQALKITCRIKTLPLIEGEYRLGIYVATSDFIGDLLNLVELSVNPKVRSGQYVPHPAAVRGVLELDLSDECLAVSPS